MANNYRHGDWRAVCDYCGREFYGSELKKEWTGLFACEADWSPRHPQDFKRGVRDDQRPPFVRAEGTDIPVAPFTTALNGAAATGDTVLTVDSTSYFTAGNYVRVALANGGIHQVASASIDSATQLTLSSGLPSPASDNANVTDIGVAP